MGISRTSRVNEVSPAEVEEACTNEHVVREAKLGRMMLIGSTNGGRVLAVILAEEENDAYYTITARPADRKERRILATHLQEIGSLKQRQDDPE
jgi:uncharacterized DUF497 family protein